MLANSRGWSSQIGAVDSERVEALEAAAAALPEGDPRRAQVLALLGLELHYAGDPARCRRLAAEALEIARAAGDPLALARTLFNACWAIWTPDMLEERKRLTAELVALAARLEDPWLSFCAAGSQWIVGSETGDRSLVEGALETMRALAVTVPQPSFVWLRLLDECIWMLIQGDLQSSERFATEAFDAGTASGEPDAALFIGGQLFIIRYHQSRAGELADQLAELADLPESLPAWRAAAAICLMQSGQSGEARRARARRGLRERADGRGLVRHLFSAGPRSVPISASWIALRSCMRCWRRSPARSRPGAPSYMARLRGRSADSPRPSSATSRPRSTSPRPRV